MDDFKLQLSLKDGPDMLNLRAETIDEFDALVSGASLSNNPQLKRFFAKDEGPSDTASVSHAVARATGGTAGSETPNCPSCGGTTVEKTTKQGKRYWACNQDRGECVNEKGYATSVWSWGKGRDS